jgi:soluble lytic murein transglycosylase-like protein
LAAIAVLAIPAEAADAGAVVTTVRASKSGRLVRSSSVRGTAAGSVVDPPKYLEPVIADAAERHQVDPALVQSVIAVESAYNPEAVSPKGAMGLMQLIPATARRFGAADAFDPRQNIEAGVKYLKYLQELFQDDKLALAAYNAGEGAVQKYGGVPPYRETTDYVRRVGRKYGEARKRRPPQATLTAEAAQMEPVPAPLRSVELFTDEDGRIHLRTRNQEAIARD